MSQIVKRVQRTAIALAAVAAVAATWFFLAPPLLGGKTSFVVLKGTSMAPHYRGGDLVVLRQRPAYHVGQIVGYRSALLHRVVMHRIVAVKNGRFLFKGDNNSFLDDAHPTERELLGRAWLRIPSLGSAISWEATPMHAPVVGLLAALLLVGGGAGSSVRRRRGRRSDRLAATRHQPPAAAAPASVPQPRLRHARVAGGLGLSAAALALVAAALTALALLAAGRPVTHTLAVPNAYGVKGAFSYAAQVPPSEVYPSGRVTTADPAFLRLVHSLDVSFAYRFASPFPHQVSGVAGMRALLQSPQGWTRTFTLTAAHPVAGDTGVITGTLHLDRLQRLLVRFQQQTGLPEPAYTLTVTPTLRLRGSVGGASVDTSLQPNLPLGIDPYELRVTPPQTLGTGPTSDPLVTQQSGSIARRAPANFSLLGLSASVPAVRRGGTLGAAAALLLALVAGFFAYRGRRTAAGDESLRIERDYGEWIVPVSAAALSPQAMIVDVTSIESLAQIAEHYESMILHERLDGHDQYLLEYRGTVYRYRLGGPEEREARPLLAAS